MGVNQLNQSMEHKKSMDINQLNESVVHKKDRTPKTLRCKFWKLNGTERGDVDLMEFCPDIADHDLLYNQPFLVSEKMNLENTHNEIINTRFFL